MNLLGRKKDNSQTSDAAPVFPEIAEAEMETIPGQARTTAPKGRPTPKRSQGRRGPVAPAPMTTAEARRRRKELGGPKLTREESKAYKAERRAKMTDRRERMMAGEDDYLLPRDKGPVRRFVRDVVDARRNVLGLFMPAALGLILVMLSVPSLQVQLFVSYLMPALVVIILIDGFVLGRKVNRLVDEKFGDNVETGWKLGFYASSRASQLRRMRAPRPRVKRGDKVT